MSLNFKDILDKPEWRPLAVAPNASAAGTQIACDLRNNEDRHPEIFQLVSATVLNAYNAKQDGWNFVGSPALTGTFGAGSAMVVAPSQGPRGAIGAGSSTTKIVTSTALAAAIPLNKLGNRSSGRGFKIRIIDNGAGGSGKTEEKLIVANTESTTPTIYLDSALSFTPVTGSTYEILAGRVYMLSAGTLAAGMWKYFDIATNTFSGNLATTNLPATIATNSNLISLDELHVPSNRAPGDGYFGRITASASGASSLTATALPANLPADRFRNYQIRIVEDATTPTSVGQRRIISTHTAGATAVLTLSTAFTVTPSATAKFVIENSNEIILTTGGQTATYTYNPIAIGAATADTWSNTRYAARATAIGAGGMTVHGFGIPMPFTDDADMLYKQSQIFSFRGGSTTTLDILDISGAAAGSWTNAATYGAIGTTFAVGSCIAYDSASQNGELAYIQLNGTQNFLRFNMFNKDMDQWAQIRYPQGAAVEGCRMACVPWFDGSTPVGMLHNLRATGVELFDIVIQR
jgi:hypothetical protein